MKTGANQYQGTEITSLVECGAEMRPLKMLFTVDEAKTYLAMKDGYQFPLEVAEILVEDEATVSARMLSMSQQGLIYHIRGKHGNPNKYRVLPWLIGIMDVQVDHLNKDYLKESADFFMNGLRKKTGIIKKLPMLRILPVEEKLVTGNRILPFDDAVPAKLAKEW